MRMTGYCPERVSAEAGAEQSGHSAAGYGRTGAGGSPGAVDMAVADSVGGVLGQVLAGMRDDAGAQTFRAGIEAGHRLLGNRAFVHWVEELRSGGLNTVAEGWTAPLQLMGKKKKQQRAAPGGADSAGCKQGEGIHMQGQASAGKTGEAGAVPEGKVAPESVAGQPEAPVTIPDMVPLPGEGTAGEEKKKKKKSRVQVALNTLRGEGVAAFGAYIETAIGEEELLRTLVERIMRAEDLAGVRKEALGVVEGRLRLPDPMAGPELPGAATPAPGLPPYALNRRQEPEIAVIAPLSSVLNRRELLLFDACARNNLARLKYLISQVNIDINMANRQVTLLNCAASWGHAGIVNELLSRPGIDVNLAERYGASPLYLAAQEGHVEVVKLLLDAHGINVNLAALTGVTPLYIAAQEGHVEVVKLLLDAPDIDVNSATLTHGSAPLLIAANNGHEEIVKLLLAAPGIDIDMRKGDGTTPLLMAIQAGFPGIVEQLVRWGADINLGLSDGTTPLYDAAYDGFIEAVRILIQAPGLRVNQAAGRKRVPLVAAAEYGHKDIVKLLIRNGADPNITTDIGLTALHVACLQGHESIVQMLLHFGAGLDARVTDPAGKSKAQTPYDFAELAGQRGVMSTLAAHRRRREQTPPPLEQVSVTEEPGKTPPSAASPEAVSHPAAATGTAAQQPVPASPKEADNRAAGDREPTEGWAAGERDKDGEATARISPVPPMPSPPDEAMPGREPSTPLSQAKDALRQEVLSKLRANNFDTWEGIKLLQNVNVTDDIDALCVLYNRLAHIERREERARRRGRRRETLHVGVRPGPAAVGSATAPVFALGAKTGLDANRVEVEIKRHLGQEYHRFVSQAVNDMEFGRGKGTAGYPGLWHASAGVAGVGSCSVFYYLEGSGERIRVVGIGHHVGRAAYRLDYASEELGKAGRILRIA